MLSDEMYVTKRSGALEIVSFDKILHRIKSIGTEANVKINYTSLAMKIIDQLYDKISTTKIDELTAEQCAALSSTHYDYGTIASHIVVSNHHKNTCADLREVIRTLYHSLDKSGAHSPLLSREIFETVEEHADVLNAAIDFKRDYLIDYFGFKTIERSYLMRSNGVIVERPQHMWMRVALGIHGADIESAIETYHLMSQKYFTHATPTLFNAGTPRPQLSSCFLISMEKDSIDGIYNTLKDCALISKWAGGIGMHIHNVRATGSQIRGTNGTSNGIVPMLRVFNNTAKYVDQCLDPNTIIYTKRGPIQIKNTILGDEVVTDDGNFYTVRKVLNYPHYKGDLYSIDVKHSMYSLVVTEMHPLYVIKNQKYIQNKFVRMMCDLDRKLVVPDFVDARDVMKNDFVGFPIPRFEQDVIYFTEDDCRMYGILVGSYAELSKNCHIYITNDNTLEFVENYLRKIGISSKVYDRHTYSSLAFESNTLFKFTQEMICNADGEKIFLPNMLHLPRNKTLKLIQGLLESSANFEKNRIQLETASIAVVEAVRYLLLRLGILTSGYTKNRCHSVWRKRKTILSIPKKPEICGLFPGIATPSKSFKFFEHNGYLFSIVRGNKKSEKEYEGRVIDIEVDNEDHHNFLTHAGLVHNGGGRRNGSLAIYLEPWHADIEMFLEMRKNHGDEEQKARDLFYALWVPDLFMERVKADGQWTLMCPNECPGLADAYGDAFNALYTGYEQAGKGRTSVKARELWFKILDAQMETGTPYICYKDAANKKSNQQNVGTIKSSNLCSEVIEYSDENETAVCNLASIALPTFVENGVFNYDKLASVAGVITRNLNRVIDVNYYPTPKTHTSNMRHRPIGIGVQGLADVFLLMGLAYHSDGARELNRLIFETIYYGAVKASADLAKEHGPYPSFAGSPASQGKLQFDLWNVEPTPGRYDWATLKAQICETGMRNSLLLAPMPTASTSQILGFNECFEPFTSNIYSRRTLAGEFVLTNKYLMRELIDMGLWNTELKNNIIANQGSIQHIDNLPEEMKQRYKSVWEIPMRHIIDMAADRGAFICQSQSLNLWIEDPTYNSLTSMHFYSWSKGLKTGIYYLRRRGKHRAQQFTIEPKTECELCSA